MIADIEGVVHEVKEMEHYGQKDFRKVIVVIKGTDGKFEQFVPVEFHNKLADSAEHKLQANDRLHVRCFVRGNSWQKDEHSDVRYFVALVVKDVVDTEKNAINAMPVSTPF